MDLRISSSNFASGHAANSLAFGGKMPINLQKNYGFLDGFNPRMERVANEAADVFESVAKKENFDLDKLDGYELRFVPQHKRTDITNMYLCKKETTNDELKDLPHMSTFMISNKRFQGINVEQKINDRVTLFVKQIRDKV